MAGRGKNGQCRVFFAADIHGSERCFRKWLNAARVYEADVLVFGGDIAGKVLVPIVANSLGTGYTVSLHGRTVEVETREALAELQAQLRSAGRYSVVLTQEEKEHYDGHAKDVAEELFPAAVRGVLTEWVTLAEERLSGWHIPAYIMLGNDDYPDLTEVLLSGQQMVNAEDTVVELPGGFEMISLGYSNPTPWNSPRELGEEALAGRITAMAERLERPDRAVFNLHCPPRGTHLDQAALLDADFRPVVKGGQVAMTSVGSTAVRDAIERYQPVVGLHGHVHESPGAQRLGRTLTINPGSEYGDGVLRGLLLNLDAKRGVRSWQFIQG
jgi:Icc-related predicted phosphoesterase